MEHTRRQSDREEGELAARVALLDKDVQNLRVEFDDFRKNSALADGRITETIHKLDKKIDLHLFNEELQHQKLNANIDDIQKAVMSLRTELKEPMETYRTAKYGLKVSLLIRNVVIGLSTLIAAGGAIYLYITEVLK